MHEAYDAGALQQFHVDMTKLAAFRYRVDDAMRAVTRHAVKEARLKEVPLPPSPLPRHTAGGRISRRYSFSLA